MHATEALRENPDLNVHRLWIVDELQDFNASERLLIEACTENTEGILLAGDDDQALYQDLKSSHPEIIRAEYEDTSVAKAMLPLCGRCSYHICMGASGFLEQRREATSIRKVFLPLDVDETTDRIRVVIASEPSTVVAYVSEFVDSHHEELAARRDAINQGTEKDPFLLILSYPREVADFYGEAAAGLEAIVEEWTLDQPVPDADYFLVLTYYRHAISPMENFPLRKILHWESVSREQTTALLEESLSRNAPLQELNHEAIRLATEKCSEVRLILEDDATDGEAKAHRLAELVSIADVSRLASDLETYLFQGEASGMEDLEEIETAGAVSPVEMMTMVRAKGLSADHVILLGFDPINMAAATWQQFYVTMTRARLSLHLITAFKARGADSPHEFLTDIPEQHCDHMKYTKGGGAEPFGSRDSYADYFENRRYALKKGRR